MEAAIGGRWAQLRQRVIDTPERQARYGRNKRALTLLNEMMVLIDDERERAGLSKAELARRMGVNPSVVRRMFSSGTGNPTLRTLLDILDILGVTIELKSKTPGDAPHPETTGKKSRQEAAA